MIALFWGLKYGRIAYTKYFLKKCMKVMLEGLLNSIKYWKKDGCRHFLY